jgi:hypothetical protein
VVADQQIPKSAMRRLNHVDTHISTDVRTGIKQRRMLPPIISHAIEGEKERKKSNVAVYIPKGGCAAAVR